VVLATREHYQKNARDWKQNIEQDLAKLLRARPTAVNLRWAIERMQHEITKLNTSNPEPILLKLAHRIHQEDIAANKKMGELGAQLIEPQSNVLTHCNAGALATGGYGTALGVIRSAFTENKLNAIYADETRPWFQGTRLTAWELIQDKIPVTLICDSAAASLMRKHKLAWVIVGADRIASNGDVANKIGTYSLAVMAREHNVGFMVVAPTSTIDMQVTSGDEIEIEEREQTEIILLHHEPIGPEQASVWNPVFDITPAEFISVLVTEKGVIHSPNRAKIEALMKIV
jgi:methylthioribose-1-phosphate isomerase